MNLRLIQHYLGHDSPTTTALYTHLTAKAEAMAREALAGSWATSERRGRSAMLELAEIFRRYGPAYRAKFTRPYAPQPSGGYGGH